MTLRTVTTAGVRICVEVTGTGPPVVLLHGFTGSAESMAGVAEGLEDVHQTLSIDLVGHGRSDAPRSADAYRMERCTGQVVAVLDALGVERAHLLGYSMGGRVALALCCSHRERVSRAVLVGASAGIEAPGARAARVRDDLALAARIEREGVASFVEHWMAHPLLASQRRLGAAFLARARTQRLSNRAHGLAGSLRGLGVGAQRPLHPDLPRVDAPILLVAGAEDPKFSAIAGDLAGRLARSRRILVPAAGHAAHLEQSEIFLRIVRPFFAEEGASRCARPGRRAARAAPVQRGAKPCNQ